MSLKEKLISSYLAFEDYLEDDSPIHELRNHAIKNFEYYGFPNKKEENWKYTSLNALLKEDFSVFSKKEAAVEFKEVKKYFLHDIDTYKIVFVDGLYSSFLSSTAAAPEHPIHRQVYPCRRFPGCFPVSGNHSPVFPDQRCWPAESTA